MKKGISEYQLSTEIGKSKSYIQSITSKRAEPSLEAISDICNYFDISISDFFDEDMDANVLCHGIARKLSFLNDEQIDVIERTVDCFIASNKG